jgi:hypothetical protein
MFYLLANGGTHNGVAVTGLGVLPAMKIALDANRTRWSAASDFASARAGMILAGRAVSATAEAQVKNAWAAVGVGDPAVTLTGLTINGPSSLNESSTATYTATASWSDGTTSTVTPTWSESSSVTTISAAGVLTAAAVTSNQTVTVSASHTYARTTKTATKTVTVVNVRMLTALSISGPATVNENSSGTYTATASWDDGTTSTVTPVWSENSTVTTISAAGVLTASTLTSNQAVTVSASYTSGAVTKTATKAVTIVNTGRILTGLSISGPSSVDESSSATYSATASWDDGTTSAATPSWSENSSFASISSGGVLTTATVTSNQAVTVSASYSSGGVTQTAAKSVTIVNSIKVLIGLSISGPAAVNEGSSATYQATALWDDGTGSAVSPAWSESSSYTTISSAGKLTAAAVPSDQTVVVGASYSSGGVTATASKTVMIINSMGAADLYVVTSCRLVDTRNPAGPLGGPALSSGVQRKFTLTGKCGIPSTAKALVLNITVVGATGSGYVSLFPGNLGSLQTSTVSFLAGTTRTNNALLQLATNGDGSLAALATVSGNGTVGLILDVSGYLQ